MVPKAFSLAIFLVCLQVPGILAQFIVYEKTGLIGEGLELNLGDADPQFNGRIGSVDFKGRNSTAVLLLYSEPNFQGQHFIAGTTYFDVDSFPTRSWQVILRNSSHTVYNVFFTSTRRSFPLQLKLNETVNQVVERPRYITGDFETGLGYDSPQSFWEETAILLFPKPFLQGLPTIVSSRVISPDINFESFQVLNRHGVNAWARDQGNPDAIVEWTADSVSASQYMVQLAHPGQQVRSRAPRVIKALDVPTGIVVESYFRPNFEWTARQFNASVDNVVIGSYKIFKANDYKAHVTEPLTVLMLDYTGFGPALALRVNEEIYSLQLFVTNFQRFKAIDVPPGYVLLCYTSVGFRDLKVKKKGYSLVEIDDHSNTIESIRMVREDDVPNSTENPDQFFTCEGHRLLRRFPLEVPNPIMLSMVMCDRIFIPPGFALLVYTRRWWLGSPYIWTSATTTQLVFGPGMMQSYRVVFANETSLFGGREPPKIFIDRSLYKPGYVEPALDRRAEYSFSYTPSKIILPKGCVLEAFADFNFEGTKALYSETKRFERPRDPIFKSYKVYPIDKTSPHTTFAGFFINHAFSLFEITPIFMQQDESIDQLIYPWDGNVQRVTVPPSLVAVTYSEARFGGRCRAWFNDSALGAEWNSSVKSMRVVGVYNWTGCTERATVLPTLNPTQNASTSLKPSIAMETTPSTEEPTTNSIQSTTEPIGQRTSNIEVQSNNTLDSTAHSGEATKPPHNTPTSKPLSKQPQMQPTTTYMDANGPKESWNLTDTDGDATKTIVHDKRSAHGSLWHWVLGFCILAVLVITGGWIKSKSKRTTKIDSMGTDWQDLDMHRLNVPPFSLSHALGYGAIGSTYLATFEGNKVAIKVLHQDPTPTKAQVQSFIDEIQLLGSINSPHIVSLVGVVWTRSSDIQAVLEYMNLGDLRQYLTKTTSQTFCWPDKIKCAVDIAHGIFYLHSTQMIHRDLKSRNVLLDSEKGAKLSDFGAAKHNVYVGETMTAAIGTYRWMAPEMLMYKGYTSAVDMYSFGVVLSELSTHKLPYAELRGMSDEAIVGRVLHAGLRPAFGTGCPKWLEMLGKRCMSADPEDRPTASQVLYAIETNMSDSMLSSYSTKSMNE